MKTKTSGIAVLVLVAAASLMAQSYGVTVKVRGSNGSSGTFAVAMYAPGPATEKYTSCLLSHDKIADCTAPYTASIDYSVPNGGEATFGYIPANVTYLVVASSNQTHAWHAFRVTASNRPVYVEIGVPDGGPTFH